MSLNSTFAKVRPSDYRELFELAHDVILMVDAAGNILDINRRAELLTGYTQPELLKMNVFEHLIIPEDRAMIRRVIGDTFDGKDSEYEVRWTAKDGHLIYFDGATIPQRSADGMILSTFCTLRVVTEQRRAERELAYQAYLLEHANDAIIATNEQLLVTAWNQAAEEMYGLKADQVLGKPMAEAVPTEFTDAQRREALRELAETGHYRTQVKQYRKDGKVLYVEGRNIALRDGQGQIVGYLTVNRDITASRRAEEEHAQLLAEERKARQDADRQREELRVLATRLAETEENERKRLARDLHDQIGQKLTALGIHLNMIKRTAGRPLGGSIHTRLDDSLALVEEMSEGIRSVILELRPSVLDDFGLVAALRWYGEKYAKRTGVAVDVEGEEGNERLPVHIELALFRVVQEALTNVARHAHSTRVVISFERKTPVMRLSIADNGIGFAVQSLRAGHSAWGLINMRERTEAVGGRFRIESAPDQGTRVIVELEQEHEDSSSSGR